MSIVKIGNKEKLQQLQARLTLRLGRRPTQQEVLDLCVKIATEKFDDLVSMIDEVPTLSPEKVKTIIDRRDSRENIPYDLEVEILSNDDRDIYS